MEIEIDHKKDKRRKWIKESYIGPFLWNRTFMAWAQLGIAIIAITIGIFTPSMAYKKGEIKKSQARNFYYIFNKEGRIIDFKYFDQEPTKKEVDEVIRNYERKQRGEI